jgi:3D-(3,5/4)-trihydroxycyclohexane-1,2-dione acylhydrolase (decyclizing)
MKTVKLTVSQALIKFLDQQYINFDGEEIKFVDSVAGIFGHEVRNQFVQYYAIG